VFEIQNIQNIQNLDIGSNFRNQLDFPETLNNVAVAYHTQQTSTKLQQELNKMAYLNCGNIQFNPIPEFASNPPSFDHVSSLLINRIRGNSLG
jgi:hypothetical protein